MSEQKNTEVNDVPEQLRIRREKRDRLLESGVEAYPVSVERTIGLKDLRQQFRVIDPEQDPAPAQEEGVTYLEPGEETEVTHAIAVLQGGKAQLTGIAHEDKAASDQESKPAGAKTGAMVRETAP